MKSLLILASFLVFSAAVGQSRKDESEITEVVKAFSASGDQYDAAQLENLLHEHHRLVLNDGKSAPFVLDKSGYIAKISSKEWGGDQREVKIESVESVGSANATVKAVLDGQKATMYSIFSLVHVDGEWKIIEELVKASFK